MIMANRVRFDSEKFGADSIIYESHIYWLPISTQVQQSVSYQVTRTDLELQDTFFHLEDLTVHSKDGLFKLERLPPRPYENDKSFVMGVTFELNQDVFVVERDLLTILDAFAEAGGFESALILACSVGLSFMNANNLDNFLAKQLFEFKDARK